MKNLLFAYAKNKGADQLCGNSAADQCVIFCFIDSTFAIIAVLFDLCLTWSETSKTGFLITQLIRSVEVCQKISQYFGHLKYSTLARLLKHASLKVVAQKKRK